MMRGLVLNEYGEGKGSLARSLLVFWWALLLLGHAGCASLASGWPSRGWVADYDTAEARVRQTGRPLLIYYNELKPMGEDPFRQALDQPPIKDRIADHIRCVLVRSYEPDRRYLAQFGVERAPALVIVHQDGTYHARTGPMTSATIAEFLSLAQPPGTALRLNAHIPRRPHYHWHDTLQTAQNEAQQTGKTMLVVFDRRFSRDWSKLKKLLNAPEIHRRMADMVHCRVRTVNPFAEATITQFGAMRLPSIVIADPAGSPQVLELPTSVETIARFVDRCSK